MEPKQRNVVFRNDSGVAVALSHKEEKFYQISKDEMIDLVFYTVLVCLYAFCLALLYRRVCIVRPALKRLEV